MPFLDSNLSVTKVENVDGLSKTSRSYLVFTKLEKDSYNLNLEIYFSNDFSNLEDVEILKLPYIKIDENNQLISNSSNSITSKSDQAPEPVCEEYGYYEISYNPNTGVTEKTLLYRFKICSSNWNWDDEASGGGSGAGSETTIKIIASGPKIDPKKENECFDMSQSAELTIYIQQGKEGTRELVGPNSVGHVFIGIKQNGIERYYGFYPETGANTAMVAVGKDYSSELRDNSKELYHVSITKSVSATQLRSIISYTNTPPATYNVNSYACTDFGIAVGKLGGIDLPATKASSWTFEGRSPGNLGEDVRNGNFPNTTKTTTKNYAPNKRGDCK